jgi:hypothetical protein
MARIVCCFTAPSSSKKSRPPVFRRGWRAENAHREFADAAQHSDERVASARAGRTAARIALPFSPHRDEHRGMKRILSGIFCALLAVCLTGCMQIEQTIKVNVDGSGTIEQKVLMNKEIIAQLKAMSAGFGQLGADAKPAKTKEFNLLDEEKLKTEASKMGEGVTLVSAKPLTTETGEGYIATYSFADVNKVKIDQNPGSAAPKGPGPAQPEKKPEFVTFKFTKGNPAQLVINTPAGKFTQPKKKTDAEKAQAEAGAAMAAQMFKNMRIAISVEVAGKIVETNATYHDGSHVTLIEMDFNKLLADPAKFKEFAQMEPDSIEAAKKLMKDIPGIKAETNDQVTIRFK